MPIINVKILENMLDTSQQQALIAELTDAVVRVGGEGMRPMTRVLVQEIRSGLWGVGGNPLVSPPAKPA